MIYVSNLGDSRVNLFELWQIFFCKISFSIESLRQVDDFQAVVGRMKSETPGIEQSKEEKEKMSAIQLSIDHNPSAYDERMRIQKAGATVK